MTNPTVTPEDAIVQAAQQLTASLKVNMEKSGIDKLNKLDAIFNTTVNNFRKQKENQNPQTRQNILTRVPMVQEEPARYPRVIA